MAIDHLVKHELIAIYFEQAQWRSEDMYSIWKVSLLGKPIAVLTVENSWFDCSATQLQTYFNRWRWEPEIARVHLKTDAVKIARSAAKQWKLGLDDSPRGSRVLYGPVAHCSLCDASSARRSWEPFHCKPCSRIIAHGQAELEGKLTYALTKHPGTNYRLKEAGGISAALPMQSMLAQLAGSVIHERRTLAESVAVSGAVGYDEKTGYDYVVDLAPAQAEAWSALVRWVQDRLAATESAALNEGTQLLRRLASGDLTPEEFTPNVDALREGRSLRR